jgi:ornithine carbamoyltransferase
MTTRRDPLRHPLRHFRSMDDLSATDLARVLTKAAHIKAEPARYRRALDGLSIALIFAKQSTRTRISFEVGIHQLGAHPVTLQTGGATGMQMGRGESVEDTAGVLSRYVDGIVIRTVAQADVEGLAAAGSVPVVNALTDMFHPCQALADLMTLAEHRGTLRGQKLVYVGAGNNVAHSLMLAGPKAGVDIVVAAPAELFPDASIVARAQQEAAAHGTSVVVESDPERAMQGADAVYTDTWVSMGEEDEAQRLKTLLAPYAVTSSLFARAKADAIFMHCLPAHRGDEVAADVIDGPRSVVFDQAENRLHAQKAVLVDLIAPD